MRGAFAYLAVLLVLILASPAQASGLLEENFDEDPVGSFPAGWQLLFNGAGTSFQHVDNTHVVSKPNSLELEGSSCWSANAFHPLSIPPEKTTGVHLHVKVSAKVYVGRIGLDSCDPFTARVSLFDPNDGTWARLSRV